MPDLYAVRGRITALQHHVNVHLGRHRPFTPSERYELWLRRPACSGWLPWPHCAVAHA